MQEQVNEKTVALYIKTGKLTAEMLQRAMKKLLSRQADAKAAYEAERRRFQH